MYIAEAMSMYKSGKRVFSPDGHEFHGAFDINTAAEWSKSDGWKVELSEPPQPGAGYRLMGAHEILWPGDQFFSESDGTWKDTKREGQEVGKFAGESRYYRRAVGCNHDEYKRLMDENRELVEINRRQAAEFKKEFERMRGLFEQKGLCTVCGSTRRKLDYGGVTILACFECANNSAGRGPSDVE